jgi:ribosomal biogenesis protein LAS1
LLASEFKAGCALPKLTGRKRPGLNSTVLSKSSFLIWTPLLEQLASSQPDTASTLADHIVSTLLTPTPVASDDSAGETKKENDSFRWCLATWLLWLWEQEGVMALKPDEKVGLVRRILSALLSGDIV